MDQENIYHHVEETRRGAFPPTDHPENVVHHPSDYDINSNFDVFPYHRKNQDYDTPYIHRQRSADKGADTVPPTQRLPGRGFQQVRADYAPIESGSAGNLGYSNFQPGTKGNDRFDNINVANDTRIRKQQVSSRNNFNSQPRRQPQPQTQPPRTPLASGDVLRNREPPHGPIPNNPEQVQRIPHHTLATNQEDVLAKMNQDFQHFARNIGFKSEKSTLANHLDTPVPDYPFVSPDQQPTDEVELPPEDSNPPRDEENIEGQPDNRVSLQKNIFGEQRLASYRYPFVYKDAPFMQLPQANLINNPKPRYLHVDSRNRDRNKYPNPNHYVYPLVSSQNDVDTPGVVYKNIHEIRLISAAIPDINSPLDFPYLILAIDEIDGIYDAATPQVKRAIGKLLFCECGGKFLRFDPGISDGVVRNFWPAPLASLSRLTLSWLKPDGTLFSWGTDTTPPTPVNEELQNSFTLQIITEVPDVREAIGHRNP